MTSKLPFVIGLGAGYVLGTRAGRAQYERIKTAASRVAEKPFVRRQGEAVTNKVADAVKERFFAGPTNRAAAPSPAVHVDDAEVRPVNG